MQIPSADNAPGIMQERQAEIRDELRDFLILYAIPATPHKVVFLPSGPKYTYTTHARHFAWLQTELANHGWSLKMHCDQAYRDSMSANIGYSVETLEAVAAREKQQRPVMLGIQILSVLLAGLLVWMIWSGVTELVRYINAQKVEVQDSE